METAAAALMEQARAALEPVSRLAVSAQGEDLEACRPHLERAGRLLEAALAAIANDGRQDRASCRALEQFRRELKKARVLHDHAGAFYSGLMRILANGQEAGYSPRGAGLAVPTGAPGFTRSLARSANDVTIGLSQQLGEHAERI